ncbi:WD repeat-containing protein 49-like [Trichomycterus rosablanca]|uniref:WD repeat-containing protein 49-like n=1 Tax=Trichomycterus rosablanca TaxID=2290929 RepID=UPI002F36112A
MATVQEAEVLENRLSMEDFISMHRLFQSSDGSTVVMQRAEFVDRFCSAIGRGSREEYERLFDSVDVSRDGWLDWDRLASYLLLGLSEKEELTVMSAVPRWSSPRLLSNPHKGPIQSLAQLSGGRYLSISKEGMMGVWAENLTLLKSHRLHNDSVKLKDLWVTGMVVMPNVHKVAVSFTSKEICFYDLLSKPEFSCQYKVLGLRHTPICLHYWYNSERPEHSVLSFGDVAGQVSAVCFRSALVSLFERPSAGVDQNTVVTISWTELQQNHHRCCYTVTHSGHHTHWVRNVRFLGPLEALVSCSASSQSSMVIAWRESETRPLRITTFHTEKGILDLDYHPGLNLVATAGINNQVRLWNPYLVSKPVGILQGHVTSVVAVQFMLGRKQLISFSKDKVLRVWDVSTQLCIQRVAGLFPKTRECRTLLFFHEDRWRLLLSFNSDLWFLQLHKEEKRKRMSHECVVTCVLYNPLFKQVISSDVNSGVTFWLIDTGQKVKHFPRCHGDAAISTMALDKTQMQLFTGGTDGVVMVWDFNGHCLHKLNVGGNVEVEITQILLLKTKVLVFDWDRMIGVFRMNAFSQYYVQMSEWRGGVQHRDDVLCAAFHPPQTLVTGSRDGEIIVWNNNTENVLHKLKTPTQHSDLKSNSDNALYKSSTPKGKQTSVNSASGVNCSAPGGKEDSENYAFTRLAFLEGRKEATATGGADLVSCGGSGVVCIWSTTCSRLVGEFVAHKDSSSITMTVDSGGRYLVTGDMDGALKVWDVQGYCLYPSEDVTTQPPALLSSLHPHTNCITHLETCSHDSRLFLLSASADCTVALSFLPGGTIGTFGQGRHWNLASISQVFQREEQDVGTHVPSEGEKQNVQQEPRPEPKPEEEPDLNHSVQLSNPGNDVTPRGQGFVDGLGQQQRDSKSHQHVNGVHKPSIGRLSDLRLEKLEPVEQLRKPDFIFNPHLYFGKMWDSPTPTPPALPATEEAGHKAVFDEKNLFPKDVLEKVERSQCCTQTVNVMRSYGRATRSFGKTKSSSGAHKTK